MKTKVCNRCKTEKPHTEFYKRKNKSGTYGVYHRCKICFLTTNKQSRQKHIEKRKQYSKEYAKLHKEQKREHVKKHAKKYPDKIKERFKNWYNKNKHHKRDYYRKKKKNGDVFYNPIKRKENHLKKLNTDPFYKLKRRLRSRIHCFLRYKGYRKNTKSEELIGAKIDIVKIYLERQFKKGMTWENHGKDWHIDHIIPLGTATNESDLIPLFHYTNLQPLWVEENLSKNKKILTPTQTKMPL